MAQVGAILRYDPSATNAAIAAAIDRSVEGVSQVTPLIRRSLGLPPARKGRPPKDAA